MLKKTFTALTLGAALFAGQAMAADYVPVICGRMPYLRIHEELASALLAMDAQLNP